MSENEIKQMRQRAELAAEITLPGANFRALLDQFQALRDERDRLRAFLDEALEEWEYSCQYKSGYLREKHGDLERIAEIKAALTPAGGVKDGLSSIPK